ncbi:gpi ethanolamine phosphate transferase 3 [Stemphylium lycopersici]|nr:gpi ethanolamine phosphate transferase 3 [Stemphylium lycopersici]
MANREVFTPLSDITGQTGASRAQQPTQQPQPQAAQAPRTTIHDPDKLKKVSQVHFKASHAILVAFFSFIFGFLLTRLVLDHKSECAVPPIDAANSYTTGNPEKGCWHPKTFDKAVVIIVDALRYDFTVPFEAQFEPTDVAAAAANPSEAPTVAPRHFHNAFPVLYETANSQPENAFLLPFIADPPTATMQRLKGLTTGTLPTFIDVGSNFAGQAIHEDNLVAQLKNASKKMVHLGDDTWHALFADYFEPNLTHAYDSFNVWDLHTVDNGVTEHIFPLLKAENASKWDVIFGHYLGVDHAGHRYGPDHPAMTAKLNQMDDVFRRMIQEIDDDTLLVVMGDHGMDAKGDHGGESEDEIQAALWMYSKKGVFGRSDPSYVTPPHNAHTRPVGQIDLVPTLSLLLGVPIPFNNLGKPIEEAFIGKKGDNFENLAAVNRMTAGQIHTYQHEYAKVRGIPDSARATALSLWKDANDAWNSLGKSKSDSAEMRQVYEAFAAYQHDTLRICRALWARFDIPRMVSGVTILASSLVVLALYARILHGDRTEVTPVFFTRGAIGLVLGGIVGVGLTVFMSEEARSHVVILSSALSGIVGCASTFFALSYRLMPPMPNSIWGWASAVFTLALSGGFASNSFTIWEDEILLHFLTTFGVLALISSFRQRRIADRTLGAYHSILFTVLLRVASFSRLCREEQMPYCKSTYYASALSTTSAPWQLAIPVATAILIPTFIKSYYEGTKSYQHNATLWIGLALRFGLMLSAAYWALDAADDGEWVPGWENIIGITKRFLAQIVLAISLAFGYSIYNWSKPLLNVIINKDGTDENGAPKEAVTVLGFANVHGSRYALLVTIWYLAVAVLQKPMGAGAIGILVWQLFSLFEIMDTNNLRQSSIGPVVLGLLGSFHFFKTGHQATLSSIQWESAFIPLVKIRYPWTPIIVILNTFGAQILCAVAVPALVLWKVKPQKKGLLSVVAKAVATHILFYATINLATTMPPPEPPPARSPSFVLSHFLLSYRQYIISMLRHLSSEVARSCFQQVKVKAAALSLLPFGHIKPRSDPILLPYSTTLCRFVLSLLSHVEEEGKHRGFDMTATHHYAQDNTSQVPTEDLVDDSIEMIPTTSLGAPQGLKPRFLKRISKLLAASMTIKEDSSGSHLDIFLSREKGSIQPRPEMDEYLRKFVRDLELTLGHVACAPNGIQFAQTREDLWDIVLVMSYDNTHKVVQTLQHTFEDNKDLFDDFVTKMFGIDYSGKENWELNAELGDRLIHLCQAVKAYDQSMKEISILIHEASEMSRVLLNLECRLKTLLGKASFANELFGLICELGFPERAFSTMVRAARTFQAFENVTFHLRPLSPAKKVSFTTSGPSGSAVSSEISPQQPPQKEASRLAQTLAATCAAQASSPLPNLYTHLQQPSSASLGPLMTAVQAFLPKEDRGQPLFRLAPSAKQETAQLIGTVSRGRLLQVELNAWYSFGFVVVKDEAEERQLAGLYAALIKESIDPEIVFREIQEAAENHKLVALFDVKEYDHFRRIFPRLEKFLGVKPVERPTVWRLKQFIQTTDDNDEPPACLKRDYGFRLCRTREDVLLLKAIYDKILHKMGPKKLHNACVHGRLLQMAMMEGVVIDVKHRRLVQNDYPSLVGFDNDIGLDGYRRMLFKNSEKKKL